MDPLTADGDDEVVVDIPDGDTALLDGGDAPEVKEDPADALESRKQQSAKRERAPKDHDDDLQRRAEEDRRRLAAELAAARREAEEARTLYQGEAVARTQAEEQAALRTEQAMRAHWHKLNADHGQIAAAITSAESEALAAERDFIRAQEDNDAQAMVAAQRSMARAEAALTQLRAGEVEAKRQIDNTRALFEDHYRQEQERARVRREQPRPDAVAQPKKEITADDWIADAEKAIGSDGARWLRDHKDFVTDPKKNRTFLRFAAQYADDNGEDALRSRDFLDAVEERFGVADGDREAPVKERAAPRRSATAAPVSRGNSFFSSSNLDARRIKLPPQLAAHVRAMGLDPVQYALGAAEDIKAGKLPKNFLDPDYKHEF